MNNAVLIPCFASRVIFFGSNFESSFSEVVRGMEVFTCTFVSRFCFNTPRLRAASRGWYIVPVCRYHKINVSAVCFYHTYPNAVRFVETGSTDVPFTNLTGFATIQGERSNLRDDYENRLFNGKKRYTVF